MVTMTTKEFRVLLREAGAPTYQLHTNPCATLGARNVGAGLTVSSQDQADKHLMALKKLMVARGHDPEAHNIRVTNSQRRYPYPGFYIRGVAKFA